MTVASLQNLNGNFDIAISDNSDPNNNSIPDVAVFLNNGSSSSFNGPNTYLIGASLNASAIASGDINADGYPDLAVMSSGDSTVSVLMNHGASYPGNFSTAITYGVANTPTAITMADFNQDLYADIAVTGSGAGLQPLQARIGARTVACGEGREDSSVLPRSPPPFLARHCCPMVETASLTVILSQPRTSTATAIRTSLLHSTVYPSSSTALHRPA